MEKIYHWVNCVPGLNDMGVNETLRIYGFFERTLMNSDYGGRCIMRQKFGARTPRKLRDMADE